MKILHNIIGLLILIVFVILGTEITKTDLKNTKKVILLFTF